MLKPNGINAGTDNYENLLMHQVSSIKCICPEGESLPLDIKGLIIRKAEQKDASLIVSILEKSFPPEDGQRRLGKAATTVLFKLLIKMNRQIVLVCDTEIGIMGYIWLEIQPFSIRTVIFRQPLETILLFISIIKERRLGAVFKHLKKRRSESPLKRAPKIMSLAVDQGARHLGIASNLIEKAQEYLMANNIYIYYVSTSSDNIFALSFYKKNGFNIVLTQGKSLLLKKYLKIDTL